MTDPWICHNCLKYIGHGMTTVNDEFERTWKANFTVPLQLPSRLRKTTPSLRSAGAKEQI